MSDTSPPQFQSGVVYSRGPLVRGILKGVWLPGLVLALALGTYIWVRVAEDRSRTLMDIAAQMETGNQRDRWIAAFDLTKRLNTPQPEAQRRALYARLQEWATPARFENDAMLMRYVAILAGMLHVDSEIKLIRRLSHHSEEVVRAAAVSSLLNEPITVTQHWDWMVGMLADSSDNVRSQVLRVLEVVAGVEPRLPPSVVSAVERLTQSAAIDLRWNATLVLGKTQWESAKGKLVELMSPTAPHFVSLGEAVLFDFQSRTIALMDRHFDAEMRAALETTLKSTKNFKTKRLVEHVLLNHPGA